MPRTPISISTCSSSTLKAARHGTGPEETAFHTGSLVGADDVFDAAMRRAGVLRIRDFSELYTAAATLGAGVRVRGRRLAIVSNAGGPGTIAADRAQDRGMHLARLGDETLRQLATVLPPVAREGNPVFVRPDVDGTQFAAAVKTCLDDPEVDSLLAILVPHALTDPDAIAESVVAIAAGSRKPVFTCWMGGDSVDGARACFAAHKVPSYMRPETAVDAIAGLGLYASQGLARAHGGRIALESDGRDRGTRAILELPLDQTHGPRHVAGSKA